MALASFAGGLTAGAVLAALAVWAIGGVSGLEAAGLMPADIWMGFNTWLDLAWQNLQLSALFFALCALLFGLLAVRLNRLLLKPATELAQMVRAEQLLDVSVALFFGIGVIWTAIGMRSALLYALGDTSALAEQGAFVVLQRLVDGGILLALSTTIVGAIGGYLMKLVKALAVGGRLQAFYLHATQAQGDEVLEILRRIEAALQPEAAG